MQLHQTSSIKTTVFMYGAHACYTCFTSKVRLFKTMAQMSGEYKLLINSHFIN